MRRRINTFLNPNVQFSYSPFGAMIPLMSYEGAGFFHCLEETPRPSTSPSSSSLPTLTPSNGCIPIVVNILTDEHPDEISWTIYKVADINTSEEKNLFTKRSERYSEEKSSYSQTVCLLEGEYKFAINDYDGIELPGYYNITYYGELITAGGDFERSEVTSFSIPWNPSPSASPSPSSSPTVECWPTRVNIRLDLWPKDIWWTIYKMAAANETQGEKLFVKRSEEYQVTDAVSLKSSLLCLQEGNYQFTIFDRHGDGLQNTGFPPYRGYYNLASNGEIIFNGEWFRKSKTYSFSIPVLPKPSTIPSTSHTPSSSPSFAPTTITPWPKSCTNTPGYLDIYLDSCAFYEAFEGYPSRCFAYGNDGEAGSTPNENCCACIDLLKEIDSAPATVASQPPGSTSEEPWQKSTCNLLASLFVIFRCNAALFHKI